MPIVSGEVHRSRLRFSPANFPNIRGSACPPTRGPRRSTRGSSTACTTAYVEPLGGQDALPFHVTAKLSWKWDAMNTVRGTTRDEDVLSEPLGRDQAQDLVTEKPCVRDIKLRASARSSAPGTPSPDIGGSARVVSRSSRRTSRSATAGAA